MASNTEDTRPVPEYGTKCVTHLRGMFAIAIYERRRRLFLARDRMGKKPFYYSVLGTGRLLEMWFRECFD